MIIYSRKEKTIVIPDCGCSSVSGSGHSGCEREVQIAYQSGWTGGYASGVSTNCSDAIEEAYQSGQTSVLDDIYWPSPLTENKYYYPSTTPLSGTGKHYFGWFRTDIGMTNTFDIRFGSEQEFPSFYYMGIYRLKVNANEMSEAEVYQYQPSYPGWGFQLTTKEYVINHLEFVVGTNSSTFPSSINEVSVYAPWGNEQVSVATSVITEIQLQFNYLHYYNVVLDLETPIRTCYTLMEMAQFGMQKYNEGYQAGLNDCQNNE